MLEDRIVEITAEEQNEECKELKIVSESSGTILNTPTFKLQRSQRKKRKRKEKTYKITLLSKELIKNK